MQSQLKKTFILISLTLLLVPLVAQALELTYPPVPGAEPPQVFTKNRPKDEWLSYYLRYIYNFIVSITGLAALYTILVGAGGYLVFGWLGRPGKMSASLNKFGVGIMGAAITLGSFIILNLINSDILSFEEELLPAPEFEEAVTNPEQAYGDYVEIPIGKLTEQALDRASSVRDQAAVVESAASSVRDQAVCVQSLTQQCVCNTLEVEGCECSDPESCAECTTAQCLGDPCEVPGTLCNGGDTDSIRVALESARTTLSSLNSVLVVENQKLEDMNNNLLRANENLKIAEDLIRSSDDTSTAWNYMSFLSVKQEEKEAEREIRIKELWPWEEDEIYEDPYAGAGTTVYECDDRCTADSEGTIPCCTLCEDVLICHGNDFKCDENNEGQCDRMCASGDVFPLSDPSDYKTGAWPASEFDQTVMFNGKSFSVPSGGVHYCDINNPGCGDSRCEGL